MLVEIDPLNLVLQSDSFIANGIRLTLLGPGDVADLRDGTVTRATSPAAAPALLETLVTKLAREVGVPARNKSDGAGAVGYRGTRVRFQSIDGATAVLDLESPRDDGD